MVAMAVGVLASAGVGGAPAAGADSELYFFGSPSGNIVCLSDSSWVRCDIRDRNWSPPPRPADCPSQTGYGQGINLEATGYPAFVCGGDTTFGGDAPILHYGGQETALGYTCFSEITGMRCQNRDNHGFTLSREGYQLF